MTSFILKTISACYHRGGYVNHYRLALDWRCAVKRLAGVDDEAAADVYF